MDIRLDLHTTKVDFWNNKLDLLHKESNFCSSKLIKVIIVLISWNPENRLFYTFTQVNYTVLHNSCVQQKCKQSFISDCFLFGCFLKVYQNQRNAFHVRTIFFLAVEFRYIFLGCFQEGGITTRPYLLADCGSFRDWHLSGLSFY